MVRLCPKTRPLLVALLLVPTVAAAKLVVVAEPLFPDELERIHVAVTAHLPRLRELAPQDAVTIRLIRPHGEVTFDSLEVTTLDTLWRARVENPADVDSWLRAIRHLRKTPGRTFPMLISSLPQYTPGLRIIADTLFASGAVPDRRTLREREMARRLRGQTPNAADEARTKAQGEALQDCASPTDPFALELVLALSPRGQVSRCHASRQPSAACVCKALSVHPWPAGPPGRRVWMSLANTPP